MSDDPDIMDWSGKTYVIDREVWDKLVEAAKNHVMTPEEKRVQKLSFIRGQTGHSTEIILKILPELTPH